MATNILKNQTLLNYKHFITTHIKKNIINHQQNYYSKFTNNTSKRCGKDIDAPTFPYVFGAHVSGLSSLGATKSRASSEFGFVGWYLAMIQTRPVLTKSVTSSLIYIAADLTSQTIAWPSSYDFIRTLRMAGYGLVVLGPTLHHWFNFMSRVLPGTDTLTTVKKMALGQTVYGPFMTAVFFSLNAALQGEDAEEIVARLKRDLLPTLLNGVMYWPACDFITFKFVPVHLQPLVSNSFSYLWTVYMTYMAGLAKASS